MRFASLCLFCLVSVPPVASGTEVKKLVIIGDSISEGYGVSRELAYPALLQKKIDALGTKKWKVINTAISGSTSASAVNRVNWALKQKPDLILLALGANDGLRGQPVKKIERNLADAIEICKKNSVKVVLAGMMMPPNYGADYTAEYNGLFERVAAETGASLIPFLLDKVAGNAELNQADGIHPNERGQAVVAETVFAALKKHL